MFNVERFISTLPVMLKGMIGIFIVTAIIILSIFLLSALTKLKKK